MNESLVQWTLLHNLDFLSNLLDFKIATKKGQEISTDYGKIDFIVENFNKPANRRTGNPSRCKK